MNKPNNLPSVQYPLWMVDEGYYCFGEDEFLKEMQLFDRHIDYEKQQTDDMERYLRKLLNIARELE
jgi:hypothetical protein